MSISRFAANVCVCIFLFCNTLPVFSIVLPPENEPGPPSSESPPDEISGRWYPNGTCVVIAPNYIITARHVGQQVSPPRVIIDGATYTINPDNIWDHPSADLRVAKIDAGNRTEYVDIYSNDNETGNQVVFAGYGKGRGTALSGNRGYKWSSSSCGTFRRATNTIESTWQDNGIQYLLSHFYDSNHYKATDYEGALALCDSGSGWFLEHQNQWLVAAITLGVENADSSKSVFGDYMLGLRLSYYRDWIFSRDEGRVLASRDLGPVPGDLNGDLLFDLQDVAQFTSQWMRSDCNLDNNWCNGSDHDRNGRVNIEDILEISEFFSPL